ncbi:Signal transduction histidine kinase [Quadrisphaera granulorum]|uniref:Signal transduction histidine-protein kinase/phosphatase MprB n=2 Tax=Quadrisphaera granulorum TaxID=317664 RepID=A0A316A5N5_9ACTN|nr:signal transduction histidine kinase [Quadrisphaera granulorum]SZE97397.1 Signal transduction histidine kinase [Quadrisphaera granulorum]
MAAVVLAVLLLGLPLAVAGLVLQTEQARSSVQIRADTVFAAVSARLASGGDVDERLLEQQTQRDGPWPASVVVHLADGTTVTAGPDGARSPVVGRAGPADGIAVTVTASRGSLWAADAQLVVLVGGLAAGAVAAGSAVGLVQGRRLVRPLEDLAERAERLGSGQVPTSPPPSGVEEVDSVAQALVRSAQQLQARLAVERQFASDASHQLRTPLTALSMRLEEVLATTDQPAVAAEAQVALEQVERLAGVVDDLLARARRQAEAPREPLVIAAVLEQQRDEWRPAYERARRDLLVELPSPRARVLAGAGPLAQALAVLLENSLAHGGGTTRVRVRVSSDFGGDWVVVEVSDEGPGVPEGVSGRIFERSVSGAGSTGLGLPLARDLVAAEGGRLELLSQRPATFAIFLREAP